MINKFLNSREIKKVKTSGWYAINVCENCEKRLSDNEKFYSNGICSHCGHDDNSTITRTKNIIIREIITSYKGILVKNSSLFEGKTPADKEWLIKKED